MEALPEIKSYLIEKRCISLDTITSLETQKLIICYEHELYITMKDIEGDMV
jgi:hypothetical protein